MLIVIQYDIMNCRLLEVKAQTVKSKRGLYKWVLSRSLHVVP